MDIICCTSNHETINLYIPDDTDFFVGKKIEGGGCKYFVNRTMEKVFKRIKTHANGDDPIFLEGETGTGKDTLAKILHKNSKRRDKPFFSVNCTEISEDLFQSAFFGHMRGSFTGATENREGFFNSTNGGTLFINEIGDLSLTNQAKLLTAIEDKKGKKIGSDRTDKYDFRLIVATHRNITRLVSEGKFREDLYFRINGLNIYMPSLNERKEDIPYIADYILDKYNKENGTKIVFSEEVKNKIKTLEGYHGNIRGLKAFIKNCCKACEEEITLDNALDNDITFGLTRNNDLVRFFIRRIRNATQINEVDLEKTAILIASSILSDPELFSIIRENDETRSSLFSKIIDESTDYKKLQEIEEKISERKNKILFYLKEQKLTNTEISTLTGVNEGQLSRLFKPIAKIHQDAF